MTSAATLIRRCAGTLWVMLLLAGCATELKRPSIPPGPVAVVPVLYTPEGNFNVYAQGKGVSAGKFGAQGMATGAAAGAIVPLHPMTILAYPLIAPYTILAGAIVGGTAGATYGLIQGLPPDQVEKVNTQMDQAVNQIGAHVQVARRVVGLIRTSGVSAELLVQAGPRTIKEVPDYAELKQAYRAVLELAVDKVGMAVRKGDPPRVALEMKMHIRVVCMGSKCVSGKIDIEWAGKPHSLDDWKVGGADLLAAEFEQGYETLAQYTWEATVGATDESHGNDNK